MPPVRAIKLRNRETEKELTDLRDKEILQKRGTEKTVPDRETGRIRTKGLEVAETQKDLRDKEVTSLSTRMGIHQMTGEVRRVAAVTVIMQEQEAVSQEARAVPVAKNVL